jgi:DNA-binding SARP family transcriptional activator
MSGGLEIKLFGVFMAERDGKPLDRLPSRKVRDLLAYLLLNRRTPRAREQMAALFWPELDGDKARHCLNTALWRLRGALNPLEDRDHPYLRVDAQSIGFNTASTFRLDVAEFESRCTVAEQLGSEGQDQQMALYRQAVDLYAGDLLTDCYEDWCLVERERLQCLYLKALGQLLAHHSRRREYEAAIACAQRILVCDPLREKVHRALIRLYLEQNQPAAALRQYHACADMVRQELGADVTPETRALLTRITNQPRPDARQNRPLAMVQRAAAEAPTDLVAAQAAGRRRLDEATALLERLHAQLGEATALVEAIRRRLDAATPPALIRPTGLERIGEPSARLLPIR